MLKVHEIIFSGHFNCDAEHFFASVPLGLAILTVNRMGKVKTKFTERQKQLLVFRKHNYCSLCR